MILSSLFFFLEYTLERGQNRPLFKGSRQKSGVKNKREIAVEKPAHIWPLASLTTEKSEKIYLSINISRHYAFFM